MAIEKMIISIVTAVIALFIVFVLVSSFAAVVPGFAAFGWLIFIVIFIAIILGILSFIKAIF